MTTRADVMTVTPYPGRLGWLFLGALALALGLALPRPAHAAGAATANTILIDGIGNGGSARDQTEALALGFDVELVTDAAVWNAKSTADFATYKAIALPDNWCEGPSATAVANRATWSPAITGNIIVVGGDPELHSADGNGAATLVRNGIGFAANDPGKTGLWVALGCYASTTPIDQFGTFVSNNMSTDTVHIVAVHPALTGLTDTLLSNWGTSTHLSFASHPANFIPLAIQQNPAWPTITPSTPGYSCYADATCGPPFLLVRGSGVQPVGLNIGASAPATADGGTDLTYTLTYGNTGGTDATGVTITAPVPTGTTFVSATGGGTLSGSTVTWAIGTLAAHTSGLTITYTVTLNAGGTITMSGAQISDGTNTTTAADVVTTVTAPASVCGNSIVELPETCDDGNTAAGDGCSATCQLESGYTCPVGGEPCMLYAASIEAYSGGVQSAVVATTFVADLCVRVFDFFGVPLAGQAVTFSAPASGATATFPGGVTTDVAGIACSPATASTVTGSYTVAATAGEVSVTAATLTNLAGAPASHTLVSAPSATQTVVVGNAFADLAVVIRDQYGNLVPGAAVDYVKASATGGFLSILSSASATTGADGVASVTAVANHFVGAETIDLRYGPVLAAGVFSLSATPDLPAALVADWASTPQSANVGGTTFTQPLGATLRDRWGNAVAGVTVLFSAPRSGPSCTLSDFTAATDAAGHVAVVATSRDLAGAYQVTASVGAITAGFSLTNLTDATAGVVLSAASASAGQHAVVGAAFANPLVVTVTDSHGNPVPGVLVTFDVPATGASAVLSSASGTTDLHGQVSVGATANTRSGGYVVTASAASGAAPVAFALVNDPGVAVRLVASPAAATQSAAVGTSFGKALAVTVYDANDNPVPNAAVAYAAPGTGASADLSTVLTASDAAGVAVVEAVAGRTTGGYAVDASSPGATGASFQLTNLPGAAGTLAVLGGTGQEAVVDAAFASSLEVIVRDRFGNVVPGVTVNFTVPATQASAILSAPSASTGAGGTCSVTATAGQLAGSYLVTATADGVATPVQFGLLNRPGAPAALLASASGSGQSVQAGEPFASPVAVTVVDAHGNPVPGVVVSFACPAGTVSCTLDAGQVTSDAQGRAQAKVTANGHPGAFAVVASLQGAGVTPASFALTTLVGPPGSIEILSGGSQQALVYAPMAAPLAVVVRDQFGNPVAGAPVAFEVVSAGLQGAGLSSATVLTGADGGASVSATANFAQGEYAVRASAPGVATPAVFSLLNRPIETQVTIDIALPVNGTVIEGAGVTHFRAVITSTSGLVPSGTVTFRSSKPLVVVPGQAGVVRSGDAVLAVLQAGAAEVDVQFTDWTSRTITAEFTPDVAAAPSFTSATVTVPVRAPEKQVISGGCASGGTGSLAGLLLIGLALLAARRGPSRRGVAGVIVAAALLLPGLASAQATFGLRLGFATAAGSAVKGSPMSEGVRSAIPLQLDAGYRILPFLAAGAYVAWAPATVGSLCGGGTCSASMLRAGVQAEWRFPRMLGLDPWLGAGLGWESSQFKSRIGIDRLEVTRSGWEYLNLQLGANLPVKEKLSVGPFLQLSVGRYGSQTVKSPLGDSSGAIADPANHSWLQIGVRGTYDL